MLASSLSRTTPSSLALARRLLSLSPLLARDPPPPPRANRPHPSFERLAREKARLQKERGAGFRAPPPRVSALGPNASDVIELGEDGSIKDKAKEPGLWETYDAISPKTRLYFACFVMLSSMAGMALTAKPINPDRLPPLAAASSPPGADGGLPLSESDRQLAAKRREIEAMREQMRDIRKVERESRMEGRGVFEGILKP